MLHHEPLERKSTMGGYPGVHVLVPRWLAMARILAMELLPLMPIVLDVNPNNWQTVVE